MWKKEVMAYFKVVRQHLPGGTKGQHKTLRWESKFFFLLRFKLVAFHTQQDCKNIVYN
jgi:hypothetical protein